MHELTGNREAVLKLLQDTIKQLGEDAPQTKKAGIKALGLKKDAHWSNERDQIVDVLKRGYSNAQIKKTAKAAGMGAVPNERAMDSWYSPRDRNIAVFQAAMDEYLNENVGPSQTEPPAAKKKSGTKSLSVGAKKTSAAPKASIDAFYKSAKTGGAGKAGAGKTKAAGLKAKAASIIEEYSNLDPKWITVVTEKAKVLFKGKHKFTTHNSLTDFRFPLADEATIAIVGDWGGGNAAAQAVAAQITAINPDHIIHLGDVYYAGTPREVQDRFLKYWPPVSPAGQSFALNSNHEMYSGGYGYFDVILKQFKQPASYFSLANKNWRFIGLDTGYVDHDLNKEQVDWLTGQFKGNNPKTILLSHHQLFSAYENTDASNLQNRVQPFLDAKQIYGWIWGHEHLCVVYEEHMGIKARCLGNGCFPYDPPANANPKVPVKWINTRLQSSVKKYRGQHTFALLRVKTEKIEIEYIDQDGYVGWRETLT